MTALSNLNELWGITKDDRCAEFQSRAIFLRTEKIEDIQRKSGPIGSGTAKITDQRSKISMGGNVIYLLAERWKTIEQLYSFFLN